MSYETTTHKVNLTGGEISVILYNLDEKIASYKDYREECLCTEEIDRIYAELQSVTDNYYAQSEEFEQ